MVAGVRFVDGHDAVRDREKERGERREGEGEKGREKEKGKVRWQGEYCVIQASHERRIKRQELGGSPGVMLDSGRGRCGYAYGNKPGAGIGREIVLCIAITKTMATSKPATTVSPTFFPPQRHSTLEPKKKKHKENTKICYSTTHILHTYTQEEMG